MTDIGGGIFSLVLTAIFLKFWKPKQEWHFSKPVDGGRWTVDGKAKAPGSRIRLQGP